MTTRDAVDILSKMELVCRQRANDDARDFDGLAVERDLRRAEALALAQEALKERAQACQ